MRKKYGLTQHEQKILSKLNTTKTKPLKCTENLPIVYKIGFTIQPQSASLKSGIYGR